MRASLIGRWLLANRPLQMVALAMLGVVAALAVYFLLFAGGETEPTGGDAISISDITMARAVTDEYAPQGVTYTFPTDARQIWAVVTLENVTRPVTVTGAWSYLGPLGSADSARMAEADVDIQPVENPRRRSGLSLEKKTDFAAGVYQLDVLIDGRHAKALQFNVVPPGQITAPLASVTPAATAAAGSVTPTPAATGQVGATATPRQSVQGTGATPTPPPAVTAAPGTYVVKSGDSLGAIAAAHGTTVAALAAANNLTNVNTIAAGQVLKIP